MAFIREYALASQFEGDPFSFKRPKWMRRLKPGKMLGRLARGALRFAPLLGGPIAGVAGLAGRALAGGVRGGLFRAVIGKLQEAGVPTQIATQAARAYGLEPEAPELAEEMVGDPFEDEYWMGDPGARPRTPKRKTAGAGGKVKAARKRAARAAPKRKLRGSSARGRGGGVGGAIAGAAGGATDIAQAILEGLPIAGPGIKKGLSLVPGGKAVFGGGRRHVNPANVKALRRSIRRIGSFQRLVKSVEKHYPRLRAGRVGGRAHGAGCKCVVCRRKVA